MGLVSWVAWARAGVLATLAVVGFGSQGRRGGGGRGGGRSWKHYRSLYGQITIFTFLQIRQQP